MSQDLDALAEIIRLHLTKSGRLASPVYLAGESYGGFRAARLAHDLATDQGIALAGVIMVSPVIEFGLMSGGAARPAALGAAAAVLCRGADWATKALEPGALADVEQFALHDYLVALAAGPRDGAAADAALSTSSRSSPASTSEPIAALARPHSARRLSARGAAARRAASSAATTRRSAPSIPIPGATTSATIPCSTARSRPSPAPSSPMRATSSASRPISRSSS